MACEEANDCSEYVEWVSQAGRKKYRTWRIRLQRSKHALDFIYRTPTMPSTSETSFLNSEPINGIAMDNTRSRSQLLHFRGSFRLFGLSALVIFWLLGTAYGFSFLLEHDFQSNDLPKTTAVNWSEVLGDQSELSKQFSQHPLTIVVAVHPKCPCTKATLQELQERTKFANVSVKTMVLAYTPASEKENPEWTKTPTLDLLQELPGASIVRDIDAGIAIRLRLEVSGAVLVTDQSGKTWLQGGITASRSCRGNCPGSIALEQILAGRLTRPVFSPVFGCRIKD